MIPLARFVAVALALSPWVIDAAPTPDQIALAQKYAPQWRFHPNEIYWPSSVEYFLTGVKQTDANGNVVNAALSDSNVDDAANQGSALYLTTDINAGKQSFLRGQNPSTTPSAVYTFAAPKANGVVDLYYWLFTPFNQGKSVPLIGEVGNHVGDWERMTVRTVNGVATQVDYHAHDDKGSGTLPWDQSPKFDNGQRPAGYVAQGSHGFWSDAGTHTYVNAVVFTLDDITADGGVAWDTKPSLVVYDYPDSFSGNSDWLNYKGAWGNIGETDCWWYNFHNECKVTTGPPGPYRDDVLGSADARVHASTSSGSMAGPLSHTLGTVSSTSKSSYTVYLNSSVLTSAAAVSQSILTVKQNCTSTVQDSGAGKNSTVPASSLNFAGTRLEDAVTKYTVSVDGCAENFAVNTYTVGVCKDSTQSDCTWAASTRRLRAFSADSSVHGVQQTGAITVTDLDLWRL